MKVPVSCQPAIGLWNQADLSANNSLSIDELQSCVRLAFESEPGGLQPPSAAIVILRHAFDPLGREQTPADRIEQYTDRRLERFFELQERGVLLVS